MLTCKTNKKDWRSGKGGENRQGCRDAGMHSCAFALLLHMKLWLRRVDFVWTLVNAKIGIEQNKQNVFFRLNHAGSLMPIGRIFETASCKTGEGQGGSYSDPHSRNWTLQLDTFSLQSGWARWADALEIPSHMSLLQVAQRCVNRVLFGSQKLMLLMLQVEGQIEVFFVEAFWSVFGTQINCGFMSWSQFRIRRAQKVSHSSLRLQLPPDPFEDWQE